MAYTYFEEVIGNGFSDVVGDPTIAGIIFLGFFISFVMLQDTRLDAKLMVLVPAMILSMVYIPWLGILCALGFGSIVYLALTRFLNR